MLTSLRNTLFLPILYRLRTAYSKAQVGMVKNISNCAGTMYCFN